MLAEDGPRGLSHLKVDRRAQVADGTTSFYYRTRTALLRGVADHLTRYDSEAFTGALGDASPSSDVLAGRLARQILSIRDEPQKSRTRARLELTMLARCDPELAPGFHQIDESFRALAERLVTAIQTDTGAPVDRALCDEQTSVLLAFLTGLAFAYANDDAPRELNNDDLRRQMRAVIIGVAAEWGSR